jgi:uncharacterized protein (DUF2141 family)
MKERKTITREMIKQSYSIAKLVYNNKMSGQEGVKILAEKHGMNPGSATDYIRRYSCLREGTVYKRTMNLKAAEYYLEHIQDDFGDSALKTALKSVQLHIDYYEGKTGSKMVKLREIYNRFKSKLKN